MQKEDRRKKMPKSIISNSTYCYICGKPKDHTHHVIGGSKRPLADKDGLTIPLCYECHNAMHNSTKEFDKDMRDAIKRIAQRRWEETYGNREEFIKRYGKNYL